MTVKQNIGLGLLIILLALFLGHQRITTFPSHVHAWAEAGQYSIALGFIENDFDFFKPETFVLNPQFPAKDNPINQSGITAVDFPIFQYGIGLLMEITNHREPFVYRLIVMLYSCLGLFFLFKMTFRLTKSSTRSLFVLLFVASSPVFVYYQTGMLISMPALSTAFISFYFLVRFLLEGKGSYFLASILFISLAAAIRTTYLIAFGAIGLSFLIEAIHQRKIKWSLFIPMFVGIGFIVLYRYYNFLLSQEYGSIFLNEFLMAENIEEFFVYMERAWATWKLDYFSVIHYVILGLLVLFGFSRFLKQDQKVTEVQKKLFTIGVSGIGASLVFLIVMSQQFPQHDYYFLDTFFVPLIMLLIATISLVPPFRAFRLKQVLVVAFFIPAFIHAYEAQEKRIDERYWNELLSTINSLEEAKETLSCLGAEEKAKILILGAHGGNLPLLLLDNKGYSVLSTTEKDIREAMAWDYDYLIVPQSLFLAKVLPAFPGIVNHFTRVGGDLEHGVFVKRRLKENQTVEDFLGLTKFKVLKSEQYDFESKPDSAWSGINRSFNNHYGGNYANWISNEQEFGVDYRIKGIDLRNEKHGVYFKGKAFLEEEKPMELIMLVKSESKLLLYNAQNLNRVIETKSKWIDLNLLFEIPQMTCEGCDITFYVWNNGRNTLYLDDLSIQLFESKKDCN